MKIFFLIVFFSLLACKEENYRYSKKNYISLDSEYILMNQKFCENGFGYRWNEALNICPDGWHLTDKEEMNSFLKKYAFAMDSLKNEKKVPFSQLHFWTSTYQTRSYLKKTPYEINVSLFASSLNLGLPNDCYDVICVKDVQLSDLRKRKDVFLFYGPTSAVVNQNGCVDKKIYVDYETDSLWICENNNMKLQGVKMAYVNDTVNRIADSSVISLKYLPPCTAGLQGKLFMLSNLRMFECSNYHWEYLGYSKVEHLEKIKYSFGKKNEIYNVVLLDSVLWMAENLKKIASKSLCYENKPENCSKYGRLYSENIDGLCADGWSVPRKSDWLSMFNRYGVNGSYIRSKNDWFLEFSENKDVGLSIYPAGFMDNEFTGLGMETGWWGVDDSNRRLAIFFDGEKFSYTYDTEGKKYYIRCVKRKLD